MSRNEWESGEIKLSTKEFGAFRRDMITAHNARQIRLFEQAKQVYSQLKEIGAGKRGFDYHTAFERVPAFGYALGRDGYHEIFDAIFPTVKIDVGWTRSRKPKTPKKSQFVPLKQSADRIDVGGEAVIGFDKKRRVAVWSVSENNHSVERAREHAIGRAFFNRLGRVVWTRGTGGEIVGNDEYNQDNRESGGGSNYVTARYGVAEKQFKHSFAGRR